MATEKNVSEAAQEEVAEAQDLVEFEESPPPPAVVGDSSGRSLIRFALEKGIDTDQLEKLIDLKNREEERQAKLTYDKKFSALQRKLGPVMRDKQAKDGERDLYSFAPIETIVKACGPTITKAGFSWRWPDEPVGENMLRVWCVVAGWGHEERTYVDMPIAPPNSFANAAQQRGISLTYGRRYSFTGAFGIVLDDEDDDAVSFSMDEVVSYAAPLAMIEDSLNEGELRENYQEARRMCGDDEAGKNLMTVAKNKKKKDLGI